MSVDVVSEPVQQLIDWLAPGPRSYAETIEAWRTHCPRISPWEDALAQGLIAIERSDGRSLVVLTDAGAAHRRGVPEAGSAARPTNPSG
jgi:hypothetical protein